MTEEQIERMEATMREYLRGEWQDIDDIIAELEDEIANGVNGLRTP